jgi:hypothetical protein
LAGGFQITFGVSCVRAAGFYVHRDGYNNCFREGFRRGHEDGYGGYNQYGVIGDN